MPWFQPWWRQNAVIKFVPQLGTFSFFHIFISSLPLPFLKKFWFNLFFIKIVPLVCCNFPYLKKKKKSQSQRPFFRGYSRILKGFWNRKLWTASPDLTGTKTAVGIYLKTWECFHRSSRYCYKYYICCCNFYGQRWLFLV